VESTPVRSADSRARVESRNLSRYRPRLRAATRRQPARAQARNLLPRGPFIERRLGGAGAPGRLAWAPATHAQRIGADSV